MAYKYVPWAAGVDGLKISTKGVLMVLTDCAFIARDEKTGKELGYGLVTLKRATIAEKCGWAKQSVKSLDRELDILEERRLIRRRRNKNPETNHRTPSDIHVLWKPWGDRTEDEGIAEDDAEPMVTSTPQGQTTTGVNNRPLGSNDHRGYGQTTIGGYGQTTTMKQGSSNKVLNTVPGEDESDSFEEWIDLFPSSKRKNLREARAKYAETINGGTTHQTLMDSTRAYLEHQQGIEDGRYISRAEVVLSERKWDKPAFKPKPDSNLTQLRTLEALAQNYPPDSPERQDYAETIKEERARLVQQGYVEDGAGGLKLPELTPEQRKSRADAHRRNEYLRYA